MSGFTLNLKTCEFFKSDVKYLGHIIDAQGLRKDKDKIKAVEVKRPENVSEVRMFVGMVNYYSKFIENVTEILSPLYELLQKDGEFNWSKSCENSFIKAKEAVTSDVVLVLITQTYL